MKWLILAMLAGLPLLGFWATHRLTGGRRLPPVLAAGAVGAAMGAFFGSVAAAMATAVNPTTALLRGGGIGLLGGLVIGGAAALATRASGRPRPPVPDR